MPRKIKTLTLSKAKKNAWDAFSLFIRTRDAFLTTGEPYECKCFTCGVTKSVKGFGNIQAGHFIPGRHNSILFDERGCHGQCYHCNVGLKGNTLVYEDKMREMYGQEVIDELRKLDGQTKLMKTYLYEGIADYYKEKTAELIKQNAY